MKVRAEGRYYGSAHLSYERQISQLVQSLSKNVKFKPDTEIKTTQKTAAEDLEKEEESVEEDDNSDDEISQDKTTDINPETLNMVSDYTKLVHSLFVHNIHMYKNELLQLCYLIILHKLLYF